MFSIFCLGIILLHQQLAVGQQERSENGSWSYDGENGVDSWSEKFPTCGEKMQSPIKIDRVRTRRTNMESIKFHGYDTIRSGMVIENNGHTVELHLAEGDEKPYIEFGGLGAKYTFAQLHFHWGMKNSEGAEHIIYPFDFGRSLEIHLVHTNPEEAKDGNAGIAVLGVTFQPFILANADYAPITNALDAIRYKGKSVTISDSFSLDSLLPDLHQRTHFFRYNGSLTTPPCTEGVIWTVFENARFIGRSQLEMFRRVLKTADGEEEESMAPNFRPVQPLNGRKVLKIHADRMEQ